MTKFYAIGFKDWVEVRKASSPPKPRTSVREQKTEKKVSAGFEQIEGSDWRLRVVYKTIPKVIKLTSIIHTGGKVVKTLRKKKFALLTGIRVPLGEVIEIPRSSLSRLDLDS